MTKILFAGAAGTVTGSRYLIEDSSERVLVDCGLFQGYKKRRSRNWARPPFHPESLDAVILTHAHIDHSGYLPRLATMGFAGPVYCTHGTRDLLQLLLPDSGHLQEEQARHANKWGYSKHHPALPLYTKDDAIAALALLRPIGFSEDFSPTSGMTARFSRAGHIIGSACVRLTTPSARVTFTGDVGRPVDPVMRPPERLEATDFLVTESTYGNRLHPRESIEDALARLIRQTADAGGTILVPAFSVGRAQHLLHLVAKLTAQEKIPALPAFLDSPMAISATKLFCQHPDDHRLTTAECKAMCDLATYTRTSDESKQIAQQPGPLIVISASGMMSGGRILHHLKRCLPDERSSVLIVGYQAAGTRGRTLLEGGKELKIHGQYVRIKAHVEQVSALSAHADYRELLDWLSASDIAPRRAFVTHGEPHAAAAFRTHLEQNFGWDTTVPEDGSLFRLD